MQIDEIRKREKALKIINQKIKNDQKNNLIDLTGLTGGFEVNSDEMKLLETYVGPAVFDEKIQEVGKKHLSGEKILPVNRTTAGIVATILTLVAPKTEIIHFLPKKPAHPSIPRTAKLVKADYVEYTDINEIKINPKKTSLVIITGTTMDYEVIDVTDFKQIIKKAKEFNVPVFVDDASGARLRRSIYDQPTAIDMGANLAVTSTDKLMDGPRGGLMAGDKKLIDQIKLTVNQYGLEAQAPLVAGMVNALKAYNPERIRTAFKQKDELYIKLNEANLNPEKTPTGFMFKKEDIKKEILKRDIQTSMSDDILAITYSMLLLKNFNIITIPALGMPEASRTIRIDWSSKDSNKISMDYLINSIVETFNMLETICKNNSFEKIVY
ncbi:MAG: TIGR03576 family pyridoxal phosphate-dependent enzyme [Methanobacteriaceae archaeon]|nr:TIGR03576 family pyridoxal phosphate-dependent enzyme [Methanobacteriaceae archaeon]